jgi:hypothetical protein
MYYRYMTFNSEAAQRTARRARHHFIIWIETKIAGCTADMRQAATVEGPKRLNDREWAPSALHDPVARPTDVSASGFPLNPGAHSAFDRAWTYLSVTDYVRVPLHVSTAP